MTMTVTTALHVAWPNLLFQLLAGGLVAALVFAHARNFSSTGIAFALGVVCGTLPCLLIAAHHEIDHWDDFMTWLANALHIWKFGAFPTVAAPPVASNWPGYPPGSSLVLAAIWSVAGRVVESAGPVVNVACLMVLPGLVLRVVGNRQPQGPLRHLIVGAMLGIVATVLNPGLDWHWVLSSLPDVAMQVTFAAAFVLGSEVLLVRSGAPRSHWAALAAILALVANLKQTGLVLIVLLVLALLLLAWTWADGERRRFRRPAAMLALVSVPWLAVWLCWQIYRGEIYPANAFGLRPVSQWYFAAVPDLLRATLKILMVHWLYFVPVLAVVVRGLCVLSRRWLAGDRIMVSRADRLAALFTLVQGGYLAFLFVCYLGAFSENETRKAAEFFRYQAHLGGAGLITAIALVLERLPRPLPIAAAPALLAAQLAIVAFILPAPGLFTAKADYGAAEFRQLRQIGKNAGRAVSRDGKPVTVQLFANFDARDELLATIIVRYEIWAAAPLLVRSIVWNWVGGDEQPARFVAGLGLAPHAVANTRLGDIHCAVHGHAAHVELLVPAADVPMCQPFLARVQDAMDRARAASGH